VTGETVETYEIAVAAETFEIADTAEIFETGKIVVTVVLRQLRHCDS